MHLYDAETGLLGTNGLVGAGIPAAVGAALAEKARGSGAIAVAFFGDGAVSHGAFHESLNLAATLSAPVVFVCENNLYATSTPLTNSTRNTRIASRASAYGIPGESVDGNDVLAVHRVMGKAAARAREGQGPTLIEARTYRTVGHHEGEPLAGTYRSQQEIDRWKRKCPILRLGRRLTRDGAATRAELDALEARIESRIDEAERFALDSPLPAETTVHDFVWGSLIRDAGGAGASPRDPQAGLAGGHPGRHCLRDEAQPQPHLLRRRHRPARRQLRPHQGDVGGVRRRSHDRYPHLRAGLYRGRLRGRRSGLPRRQRPDVQRLHVRGGFPDHSTGRQAALHEQRPVQRAAPDSGPHGGHQERRPPPQRRLLPHLGPLPRPDGGGSLQRGRCQGPVHRRPAHR